MVEQQQPFQARVEPWMRECFGDVIPFDKVERGDRLLEEVFELLQSGGYDPARVLALRDYTWNRPAGELAQEVGGVMVTLAAYCLAFGLDMHAAGETELARIWTKVDVIRAKQAAKPTGSALPVAVNSGDAQALASRLDEGVLAEALERALRDAGLSKLLHASMANILGRHMAHHIPDVAKEFATSAAIEAKAREIYEAHPEAGKYPWVPGGNSLMQDEARVKARQALADATPGVEQP